MLVDCALPTPPPPLRGGRALLLLLCWPTLSDEMPLHLEQSYLPRTLNASRVLPLNLTGRKSAVSFLAILSLNFMNCLNGHGDGHAECICRRQGAQQKLPGQLASRAGPQGPSSCCRSSVSAKRPMGSVGHPSRGDSNRRPEPPMATRVFTSPAGRL